MNGHHLKLGLGAEWLQENISEPVDLKKPVGIFAGELMVRSTEYRDAFRLLAGEGEVTLKYPAYFLLSHALELLLKSFLAAKLFGKSELSKFPLGHNIKKLYGSAIEKGLPHDREAERLVEAFDAMNSDHDFRYPSGYTLWLPSPRLCVPIYESLEAVIQPTVERAAVFAQASFAAETRHYAPRKIRFLDGDTDNRY